MTRFTFAARSHSDTDALGQALAGALPDGTTVALCGTLGAGKTRLVQAVAAACGVPRDTVTSPTFVLCQEHHGRRLLYHMDAYRLRDSDEFLQLGPEEYFDAPALIFVEWADRVADCLPPERIEVHIEATGDTTRSFEVVAVGARYEATIAAIQTRLNGLQA